MRDLCDLFYYSGIEGNENQFKKLEDCVRICNPKRASKPLGKRSLSPPRIDPPPYPALTADYLDTQQKDPFAEPSHYGGGSGHRGRHGGYSGRPGAAFGADQYYQKVVATEQQMDLLRITLPDNAAIEWAHVPSIEAALTEKRK